MQYEGTPVPEGHPPVREALLTRLDRLGFADQLTISIPEAGRLLGLGETASYAAAHRGEIPFRQFGKKKRVFVDALLAMGETDAPRGRKAPRRGEAS